MSMMKRIFALLLTVVMLVSVLAACNKPQTPEGSTPDQTTPDPNPLPNPPETPAKKITSVKISSGESAIESFAATELKWYLAKKNIPLAEDGYSISFIIDERVAEGGYRITADENGLTVMGGDNRGLANGLYGFLEKFLGVHIYSADTTVIDDGDLMIGGGVLDVFEPAFEVIRNPWAPIDKLPEKDGGSRTDSNVTQTLALNALAGTGNIKPCLSDPEIFAKAVQNVRNYLRAIPDIDIISFTPKTEVDPFCTCESCARVHEEEGSPAGNYVRFLNKLYKEITVDYPDLKFELVIRSYLTTAPSVTKPVDGILIRFNTASCHISHPLTDASCPEAADLAAKIKSWGSICDNIHIEYALTAAKEYMPIFANLGTLRENMNFFAEYGVSSINFTGNIACPSGEFGELRVYLISKLIQDPTMSEEEYYGYMDSFLKAFYGEGWTYIRKFIDKIIELSADGHQMVDGSPFDAITKDEYLANEATFDEWWNKAEELAGDRIAFVKRGRYQWRYIKLCLHPNKADALALIEENKISFNERVAWREKQWNVDTASSNLDLAPTEWIYKS